MRRAKKRGKSHKMPKVSFVTGSYFQAMARLLTVGDALLIVASVPLSYLIQGALRHVFPSLLKAPPDLLVFATLAILTLPVWLFFITRLRLHEIFDRSWKKGAIVGGLLKVHAAALITLTTVIFLTQVEMNRSLIGIFMACTFTALFLERAAIQFRMRYRMRQGSVKEHLLLVGENKEEMRGFVRDRLSSDGQVLIVGRIGDSKSDFSGEGQDEEGFFVPKVGELGDLGEILHAKAVDRVLFFPPLHDPASCTEALKECEAVGVPACFYVHTARPLTSAPKLISYHRYPFFIFEMSPKPPDALIVKYTFDTIASALGLIVISPLLFLVSFLILVTMGRPIFFSQVRSGLFGREFRMHKFRTMVQDAEKLKEGLSSLNEMDGPVFKIKKDPRITRLGRFLRKWSIDELPQLFNVLTGDMSLVGPRPLPIKEQKEIVGWKRRRLSMRPGITGLWQTSGRNDIDFEDWMKLDLEYIDHWSLGGDFKILLKTVKTVLSGKGAS